jgi:hypothetical protein
MEIVIFRFCFTCEIYSAKRSEGMKEFMEEGSVQCQHLAMQQVSVNPPVRGIAAAFIISQ